MNSEDAKDYPYTFDQSVCRTCRGTCCRGSGGYVWVTMEDIEKIAAYQKIDLETFSNNYVRAVQGELSLQERQRNGENFCCFFDEVDEKCMIYPVRPGQCRSYPFWDIYHNHPRRVETACPGVRLKGVTYSRKKR